MGIKNVFKWRVTSTKYLYLTDEENKNPFILDKKTGDRFYPVPENSSPVTGSTKVTGVTLDEGLISQTVAQIKSETVYAEKYNRMVELAAYDEAASGLTFLDYTNYFNLDDDECVEEAVTPKCEGYEPVFNVSAYTETAKTEVEYSFYADKNESDKTLRYNLKLGIPRGEKGEKGDDGVGCKGEPGEPGLPAIIDNVSATIRALDPDEQPDVKVVSSSTQDNRYDLQFNFKIPRGEKGVPGDEGQQGEDGIPARLAYVGIESETLLPNENAYVQIKDGSYEIEKVYDSEEGQEFYDTSFTLQFGLPQGLQGIQGEPGRNAEIRNVTVSRVETIEPGYWYPNEEDPNREWIWNEAQAGVEITPTGGGNIVDLAFWFIIPRGAKGDKGDDGSGGGGSIYNFKNPVKDLSGNPVGSFTVTDMIDGTHNVELTLWGSGGGETDIKHRYDPNVDSLSEGVLPIEVDNEVLPYAVASGVRSHAEGIGITPEPPALTTVVAGFKSTYLGSNTFVMPKQQFVDADVDWEDIDESFFIGATFQIPSGITINPEFLPSGVTEINFRNSTLTITNCQVMPPGSENNYFNLSAVSVSYVVDGTTYTIENLGGNDIFKKNNANYDVDWNNPITIHINNVSPISIPNAIGVASHTEGNGCQTNGEYSHAEGNETRANGVASHSEGAYTKANGDYSHAGGFNTTASGQGAHASGYAISGGTIQTSGDGAFAGGYAEGDTATTQPTFIASSAIGSFAFGKATIGGRIDGGGDGSITLGSAYGDRSYINAGSEGSFACGYAQLGGTIKALSEGAHAEGCVSGGTIQAGSSGAHAGGYAKSGGTIEATSDGAYAGGYVYSGTIEATGAGAHAEGYVDDGTIEATSDGAHAEGRVSGGTIEATGAGAHAEGYVDGGTIQATADGAHAEGYASGDNDMIIASGMGSHAEGRCTTSFGDYSHAEGYGSLVQLSNISSRTATTITFSTLPDDIKIGRIIKDAYDVYAKVTNINTSTKVVTVDSNLSTNVNLYLVRGIAFGDYSHAEGDSTTASGESSHAEGQNTIANIDAQTVVGKYNDETLENALFVVGNGTDEESRSNAFYVENDGDVYASGAYYASSDVRKKNVVGEISLDKAYDLVNKCQTIFYTWKNSEEKNKQIGLLAQEVQQYFPELVSEGSDGYLTLDYSKLTVILLVVIRDLTQKVSKIDTLEEKIKQLEKKIQ